jgi:hypothetical protein
MFEFYERREALNGVPNLLCITRLLAPACGSKRTGTCTRALTDGTAASLAPRTSSVGTAAKIARAAGYQEILCGSPLMVLATRRKRHHALIRAPLLLRPKRQCLGVEKRFQFAVNKMVWPPALKYFVQQKAVSRAQDGSRHFARVARSKR